MTWSKLRYIVALILIIACATYLTTLFYKFNGTIMVDFIHKLSGLVVWLAIIPLYLGKNEGGSKLPYRKILLPAIIFLAIAYTYDLTRLIIKMV